MKSRAEKLECKKDGKRYWSSLDKDGNTAEIYCQSKNLVAFADFKNGDTNLYTKTATIPFNATNKTYDIHTITVNTTRTISVVGSCPPNSARGSWIVFAQAVCS